jgi:uncharacterized protein YndB with AHSA1/START domain
MAKQFEVTWDQEFPSPPEDVWDAFTVRSAAWLWDIHYEPRVGGAEKGLTAGGGLVTAWEPGKHFTTRADGDGDYTNEIDYQLEPRPNGTHVRYRHRGVVDTDADIECCRQHTDFYRHSLGQYLRHFTGRTATGFVADAPETSADHGYPTLRRALGVPGTAAVGDKIHLTPEGLDPIDGVIDYATGPFLGIRTADALYRLYGRDTWGHPVGISVHLFAADADAEAAKKAWHDYLTSTFTTEAVAR